MVKIKIILNFKNQKCILVYYSIQLVWLDNNGILTKIESSDNLKRPTTMWLEDESPVAKEHLVITIKLINPIIVSMDVESMKSNRNH